MIEIISPNVSETGPLTQARRNFLREQKKTDTTPLDETSSRHGEANSDQADENPEPTTEIISLSNLSCLRPSFPVSFFFILVVGFVLIMFGLCLNLGLGFTGIQL
ncbi:unnamed protein product [Brassica rapa subsp. trilocularis]